jgi:hypothetical protein
MDSFAMIAEAVLPLIVFAVSGVIVGFLSTHKGWILFMPVLAGSMFVWYPGFSGGFSAKFDQDGIMAAQVFLMAVWFLLVLGSRHSGIANKKLIVPKALTWLLTLCSLGLGAWCWHTWGSPSGSLLSVPAACILIFALFVYLWAGWWIQLLICPLVVLDKEECRSALADYGVAHIIHAGTVKRNRVTYCTVRFENDPEEYLVGRIFFRGMRNRVGSVYAYVKCKSVFDMVFIRRVELVREQGENSSLWEKGLQRPRYKGLKKVLLVLVLAVIVMAGLVMVLLLFAR